MLRSLFVPLLFLCGLVSSAFAEAQEVLITEPFVKVYEKLDPRSMVIKIASQGERIELIYAGPQWYQVKVNGKEGWLERTSGRLVVAGSGMSTGVSMAIIIAILLSTVLVVTLYLRRQHQFVV